MKQPDLTDASRLADRLHAAPAQLEELLAAGKVSDAMDAAALAANAASRLEKQLRSWRNAVLKQGMATGQMITCEEHWERERAKQRSHV